MTEYVLSPDAFTLEGTVQPDRTQPWKTERATLLTYTTKLNPAASDTVVLNIDRDRLGPFTARTFSWTNNQTAGFSSFTVSVGPWSRVVSCTQSGSILIPRSSRNVEVTGSISWETITIQITNVECHEVSLVGDLTGFVNGPLADNYMYGTPVVVAHTVMAQSIFSSGLITAAGTTLLTSRNYGLIGSAQVHIAGNSTLAVAGNNKLQILSGSFVIWEGNPYIPAAIAAGTGIIFDLTFPSPIIYNNGLDLSVGTAFTAGGVEVNAWG